MFCLPLPPWFSFTFQCSSLLYRHALTFLHNPCLLCSVFSSVRIASVHHFFLRPLPLPAPSLVVNIGSNNHVQYLLNDRQLFTVNEGKDLGIPITSDLQVKHSQYCSEVVKTANTFISVIGCTFENKPKKITLSLYS